MIWLASFPRSGNTYLRNLLYEVFGLRSSTWHQETAYPVDRGFGDYPFVKTHQRPGDLEAAGFDLAIPAVCLVRDGRDAMCSIAHHRADLVAPGSDVRRNMEEAIVAQHGSFFGGWSTNVDEWVARADLIIRYEDLVADPLGQAMRIGQLIELPEPQPGRMPSFESLKHGIPEYGAGKRQGGDETAMRERARRFFRRGVVGAWRDEMPEELQELFWSFHGDTMARLGYTQDGTIVEPHPDLDLELRRKLGIPRSKVRRKYRVLMEADKLLSADNDGVKRYQVELLRALYPAVAHADSRWQLDLYHHGNITPVRELAGVIFGEFLPAYASVDEPRPEPTQRPLPPGITSGSRRLKAPAWKEPPHPNPFIRIERRVMSLVPRGFVRFLERHRITVLHDIYEFFRGLATRLADAWDWLSHACRELLPKPAATLTEGREKPAAYDLVHLPLMQHYKPFRHDHTRKLVTIHDLTHLHFPELHTEANTRNAQRGLEYACDSGASLLAVSAATRDDILQHTGVDAGRVHVVLEAADPILFHRKLNSEDCRKVRKKYGIEVGVPYIVSLSTLEPRKNLENTIRAFVALLESRPEIRVNLVIAGKRGWDCDGIYQLAEGREDRIHFTGFVDDKDLPFLYSDALCLSYLSFYEGFGLPPLEAMRCGTPVVFGDNSSIREVVGAGGLPADPHDIEQIQQQFLRLIGDEELRQRLGRAALRRASDFSWRQAAIETLALYEKVING